MKCWEAMKALEEGKKVRQKNWHEGMYSFLDSVDLWVVDNGSQWPKKKSMMGEAVFSEWELYEEPEQLLSFAEVVNGLKKGKRFRRKNWEQWAILGCGPTQIIPGHLRTENQHGQPCPLWIEDFEANDWVEVKDCKETR